ncbi:MAG: L,D-transpeptidase [Nitrospirales bacterium]|nr:L,D-transpeptidase [Nitrospirales bacterium]MBA3968224.1 L,D-transpeptidase [Nitrospirales bacterium]
MAPDNRDLQFPWKTFETLKSTGSIVFRAAVASGALILPLLLVLASPFLNAFSSTPLSIPFLQIPQSLSQDGPLFDKPAHTPQTLFQEIESSPSQPLQTASNRSPNQKSASTQAKISILVDISRHRLFVKEGDHILHEAIASTGRGNILADPRNPERTWTFETPKGTFSIESKLEKPVWIRPDWAFIEQGDPVPGKMVDRLKPGMLGHYALGFGNGYFIHGALYLNLLGQDVTHGCIQLHPQDLQFVFKTVPLGTPLTII